MLLVRVITAVALVIAAILVIVLTDSWWTVPLAAVILIGALSATVAATRHYMSADEWEGPGEEAELQAADLVEADTGLPKRGRWNAHRAEAYARELRERGRPVAVPEAWRGPPGGKRVLLIATVPASPADLERALPDREGWGDLAALVIVPALPTSAARLRVGDETEAVEHAEAVVRQTISAFAAADVKVSGHVGPADPAVALSDGLRLYDAQCVVAIRRHGGDRRYLEDVPLQPAADTFGVPLREYDASGERHRTR